MDWSGYASASPDLQITLSAALRHCAGLGSGAVRHTIPGSRQAHSGTIPGSDWAPSAITPGSRRAPSAIAPGSEFNFGATVRLPVFHLEIRTSGIYTDGLSGRLVSPGGVRHLARARRGRTVIRQARGGKSREAPLSAASNMKCTFLLTRLLLADGPHRIVSGSFAPRESSGGNRMAVATWRPV